jgi:hypothetical protein
VLYTNYKLIVVVLLSITPVLLPVPLITQASSSYWGPLCLRHGDAIKDPCRLYGGQPNTTTGVSSNYSFEDYPADPCVPLGTCSAYYLKTYSNHGISFQYYSNQYLTVQVNNGIFNGLNNTLLVDILDINPDNFIPMEDLNITVFELNNPQDQALFNHTYGREANPGGDDIVIGDGIHAYRITKFSNIVYDPSYEPQSSITYLYTFTNKNKGYVIDFTASPGVGVSNEDAEGMLASLKIQQ